MRESAGVRKDHFPRVLIVDRPERINVRRQLHEKTSFLGNTRTFRKFETPQLRPTQAVALVQAQPTSQAVSEPES